MKSLGKLALAAAVVGTLGLGGVSKADSINTRLHGRALSDFVKHRNNFGSANLGFALMFPASWTGKYKITEDAKAGMVSISCEGKLVLSILKAAEKDYNKMSQKGDFMGEYLHSANGVVFYADKSKGRPELMSQKAYSPACQALVDSTTSVTQSFMLVKDGKLVNPLAK